jgi:hypothetical protein
MALKIVCPLCTKKPCTGNDKAWLLAHIEAQHGLGREALQNADGETRYRIRRAYLSVSAA